MKTGELLKYNGPESEFFKRDKLKLIAKTSVAVFPNVKYWLCTEIYKDGKVFNDIRYSEDYIMSRYTSEG